MSDHPSHQASKTGIFAQRARVDKAVGLYYRPKRKLNILVDLTLGKSYHSVVTFLNAQKIKCYTFSIQISSN